MKNKIKFLGAFGVLVLFILFAFKPKNDVKLVVIDAGHGGKDFGATSGDITEKQIVQNIASKIKSFNKNNEIEIVLVRDEDNFIDLNDRVLKINNLNPSLLISLHINSSEKNYKTGVNAYVYRDNSFYAKSSESANNLLNKLSEHLVRGEVKDANYYILKNSKCPALTLEIGYLSNEIDKKYIATESGQNQIANEILEYIQE